MALCLMKIELIILCRFISQPVLFFHFDHPFLPCGVHRFGITRQVVGILH